MGHMTYEFDRRIFAHLIPQKPRKKINPSIYEKRNIEITQKSSNNTDNQVIQVDSSCDKPAPSLVIINDSNSMELNIENNSSTPISEKETNTPLIKSENKNEMKYTKYYFVKINFVLYLIYLTLNICLYLLSLNLNRVFGITNDGVFGFKKKNVILVIRIFNIILLLFDFICGFRELCYVISMDIKNKKVTRKLYTINSFLLYYFFCPCNTKEINLKEVDYFMNENYWNFEGNCTFYGTKYFYFLGVMSKSGKEIELIKKCAQITGGGFVVLSCYLYHRFSKKRFDFDELVEKLNDMLEKNREYINQD